MGNNVEKVNWNQIKKILNHVIRILDFDHSIYPLITIRWSSIFFIIPHFRKSSHSDTMD